MIETKRLLLRPWEEADSEALFRYASDPDVGPAAGWPAHRTAQESLNIIRSVFSAPETYAMVLKESGEPVGCCGIIFPEESDDSGMRYEAEIGYWIGKPHWGKGLTPEAVSALLSRSFLEFHLDTVWCAHYDGNDKSKRVCEKSGFRYHHTDLNAETPLGDRRTEHFYIMTKEDFHSIHLCRDLPD